MGEFEDLATFGADERACRGGGEGFDTREDEGDEGGEDEGLDEQDESIEEESQGATCDVGEGALASIDGIGAFAGDGGKEEWPADEISSDDENGDKGQTDGDEVKDGADDVEHGPAERESGEGDGSPEECDEDDGSRDGEKA